MIADSLAPEDIRQGSLGDCWLLSSMAVLTRRPELLRRLLVTKRVNKEGVYALRLFKEGRWTTVFVDDRLPVK